MSTWHNLTLQDDGTVLVELLPSTDRFWPPEIIRDSPLCVSDVSGRTVVLTGAGSVWMYAHAAAVARAAGASEIQVRTPYQQGTSNDLEGSESLLILAGRPEDRGVLLSVRLRTSPALSPTAINQLIEPRLEELSRLRPHELALTGRASAEVYVRAARTAVDSGVKKITCWSARDGLVVIFDPEGNQIGHRVNRPDWMAQAMPRPVWPLVIGVAGDPNLGKSVFSSALDWYRERIGCDGWKLDCDGQAPTSPWYLSLVGRVPESKAEQLRKEHKRPWTPEMEMSIVEQLRKARDVFSVLIADLPGGDHRAIPPQRIPKGRERIFAEVDALVLLERVGAPSEAEWFESLRPHGLHGRIAAVLVSRDPQSAPSLSVRKDGNLWRGEVTGLERSRLTKEAKELAEAFKPGFDQLWPALLEFARQRPARH